MHKSNQPASLLSFCRKRRTRSCSDRMLPIGLDLHPGLKVLPVQYLLEVHLRYVPKVQLPPTITLLHTLQEMDQVEMQRKTKSLASEIAPDPRRDETAAIGINTRVAVAIDAEIAAMTARTPVLTEGIAIASPIGRTETGMTVARSGTIAVVIATPTGTETLGTGAIETTDEMTEMADARSAPTAIGVTDTTGTAVQIAGGSPTERVAAALTVGIARTDRTAAKVDLQSAAARTETTAVIAGPGTGAPSATDTAAVEALTGERLIGVFPRTATRRARSLRKRLVETIAWIETTI